MMGRIFFAAAALILTKVLLGKADAVACAVTLLVAFTVYFVMSFATREGPLQGPGRRKAPGLVSAVAEQPPAAKKRRLSTRALCSGSARAGSAGSSP